jgi:hypothetical protein
MLITSHTPNVSMERATAMFLGSFRELRYGRLRVVIDFHLPYYLFLVRMVNNRKSIDSLYGIDAITGRLDPYQFENPVAAENCRQVETSYSLPPRIGPRVAFECLEERMMRLIFMRGVFKLREWKVSGDLVESFYIPYWVGVYERKDRAHLEVIDALRGRFEGAKVREMVMSWFMSR